MQVYLARKNGVVIHHTDLAAMEQLDGISTPELTITLQEWEAAGGLARIIGDQIILGKTEAEIQAETERSNLTQEEAALIKELADDDYKVIKAAEAGQTLDDLYPGLHEERQQKRNRINEIQTQLEELAQTA